ncbi:MAG: hypothetical protein QM778_37780 [Myxococcales bacterium]
MKFENPYALKKRSKQAKRKVDPTLAAAVGLRISSCYQAEQGKELTPEEKGLLDLHAADLVRDLASAFASTSCALDTAPSATCSKELSAMRCETLAQPIIMEGWDRNLTPEAKAKVAAYAQQLSARIMSCEGRDAEEAAIVGEVETSKLSVLIESKLVTGQCELVPGELAGCADVLKATDCADLQRRRDAGLVSETCRDVLRCRDMKVEQVK